MIECSFDVGKVRNCVLCKEDCLLLDTNEINIFYNTEKKFHSFHRILWYYMTDYFSEKNYFKIEMPM